MSRPHTAAAAAAPPWKKNKRWETRTTNFRLEIFKKMNVEGREMEKEKSGRPGQQQLLLCHHHHHHHHGRCNLITTGTVQQRHQPKKLKKVLKFDNSPGLHFFSVCCFPWAHGEGQSKSSELFVKILLLLFGPLFLKKKAATMNALYSPVHT
jgi:hypothetical protein